MRQGRPRSLRGPRRRVRVQRAQPVKDGRCLVRLRLIRRGHRKLAVAHVVLGGWCISVGVGGLALDPGAVADGEIALHRAGLVDADIDGDIVGGDACGQQFVARLLGGGQLLESAYDRILHGFLLQWIHCD